MMKKTLLMILIAALIAVAAFMLGGCNNEPVGEPDGGAGDAGEVQTLKVALLGKDIKIACILLAKELGYYEEERLNVEFETISNLSDGVTALDMGKLDVLPFGVIPSATFIGGGTDLVVFGGTISEGSEIIVTPENAGMIQTLEDFRGKNIGCYRMETGHMVIKGLLRGAGMEIGTDVNFVLLDSQQTIIEAVRKGEVDLGFLNSGQGYIAQLAGLTVDRRVGEFNADFPCCRQTTSRASFEDKKDALVKFQIANLRAYQTYMEDKETTIATLAAYSGQDPTYVEAVMYGLEGEYQNAMIISLDPNKNKVVEFYEVMKANEDIDPNTPYNMEDHIDTTIYQEALQAMMERHPDSELFDNLMEEFLVNNQ